MPKTVAYRSIWYIEKKKLSYFAWTKNDEINLQAINNVLQCARIHNKSLEDPIVSTGII